ncbi:expressed unknown protein [Seminavis robusta]|uniref:Plastid lipid-associated protein/fibrillin conserved domain-containing protein n=1 Tax=Seminavis robusta TaxID=568900 RepID=A0A9N8DJI5_9STRA|nr:expressed unknown protein [Seminavis robusta]|eukprot:Sro178_g077960.1 n/a (319) ;mRNA; f:2580-3536
MKLSSLTLCILAIGSSQLVSPCHGFLSPSLAAAMRCTDITQQRGPFSLAAATDEEDSSSLTATRFVEAVPMLSSVTDPEAIRLRDELLQLAEDTNKGFSSTPSQKKRASEIIAELAKYNPTPEPALPYYTDNKNDNDNTTPAISLAGKWDLIYTDAPDITSLDTSRNPLATAKLGRIGQECDPPFIKNVIEWKKPDWVDQLPLPFAGDKESRILQKVCTKATASPDNPMLVNLEVAGIDLVAPPKSNGSSGSSKPLQEAIEDEGLPVGILRNNPLELRGPLTAPFGQFEILYLDEEMRIIRTGQNYLAVNVPAKDDWF